MILLCETIVVLKPQMVGCYLAGKVGSKFNVSADVKNAENWKKNRPPKMLYTFLADYIYNGDETGLFYPATPDGSWCSFYSYVW